MVCWTLFEKFAPVYFKSVLNSMPNIAWSLFFQSKIYLVSCKSVIYRCTCISCFSCLNSFTLAWEKSRGILPQFYKNLLPGLIPVFLSERGDFFFYFFLLYSLLVFTETTLHSHFFFLFMSVPFSLVRTSHSDTPCFQGAFQLPGLNASWTLQKELKPQTTRESLSWTSEQTSL